MTKCHFVSVFWGYLQNMPMARKSLFTLKTLLLLYRYLWECSITRLVYFVHYPSSLFSYFNISICLSRTEKCWDRWHIYIIETQLPKIHWQNQLHRQCDNSHRTINLILHRWMDGNSCSNNSRRWVCGDRWAIWVVHQPLLTTNSCLNPTQLSIGIKVPQTDLNPRHCAF